MINNAEVEFDTEAEIQHLDAAVIAVAGELPFVVDVDADMGGTFTQQILLGRRGSDEDDPQDRAGIDPEPEAVWWLDLEGGREQIFSTLDRDAPASDVAAWIATEARRAGSPAALPAAGSVSSRLEAIVQRQSVTPFAGEAAVQASPSHGAPTL